MANCSKVAKTISKLEAVTEAVYNIEEALGYSKESSITKLLDEIRYEIDDLSDELDNYLKSDDTL